MKPNKFTLYNGSPSILHACKGPASADLTSDKILCNEEPVLPGDYHPYNMRLWVIGHEFGAICAVWGICEQAALDAAVDCNMLDCFLAEEQDYNNEELASLGNAGELFDLAHCWMFPVSFQVYRDWELLKAFARCGDNETLDY